MMIPVVVSTTTRRMTTARPLLGGTLKTAVLLPQAVMRTRSSLPTTSFIGRSFSSDDSPKVQETKTNAMTKENKTTNTKSDASAKKMMLLYHRNASRDIVHRAFFGVSVFNTVYWSWYVLDFVPAVNGSPIEDLHIDPAVGMGGIALGLMINSLAVLYPKTTISRLGYSPSVKGGTWYLWTHSFPFLGPSQGNPKEFPLGALSMDPTSTDTKKVLVKGIESYSGHLGILVKGTKFPYLMEIKDPAAELPGGTNLLLQALLNPGAIKNEQSQRLERGSRGGKGKKRRQRKR